MKTTNDPTCCPKFGQLLTEKGFSNTKIYHWYTTCPKCAKKYGNNYVVMVAQVG